MPLGWNSDLAFALLRQRRFREMLDDPPECNLVELRRSCHLSQALVAASLGVRQLAVSRLERRGNLQLGTLRAYITALGGQLELVVRFPHRAVRLR